MKRILSIAVVTVSVTGLLGAASVRAQMMMSGGGQGVGSSGGTSIGGIGGWSLAPAPSVPKKKTTAAVTTGTSGTVLGKSTTPSGAWSVVEDTRAATNKPATSAPAPTTRTTVASKTATDGSAAAARPRKMAEAVRLTGEATNQKPALP
jgi:hypothetical protein